MTTSSNTPYSPDPSDTAAAGATDASPQSEGGSGEPHPFDPHRVDEVVDHFVREAVEQSEASAVENPAFSDRRPPLASRSESVTKQPEWHYEATSQEEAIARLLFLASHRRPAGLLTGPSGVGKSHVLSVVGCDLRRAGTPVLALDMDGMDADGLIDQASVRAGLAPSDHDPTLVRLRSLRRWVDGQLAAGRLTVLVDHLDRAEPSALVVLDRLLSQCESGLTSPTLLAAAEQPTVIGPSWLRRHASLRVAITPMDAAELAEFFATGLADYEPHHEVPQFTPEAVALIHESAGGSVRTAASIASTAFIAGRAEGFDTLSAELVEAILPQLCVRAAA